MLFSHNQDSHFVIFGASVGPRKKYFIFSQRRQESFFFKQVFNVTHYLNFCYQSKYMQPLISESVSVFGMVMTRSCALGPDLTWREREQQDECQEEILLLQGRQLQGEGRGNLGNKSPSNLPTSQSVRLAVRPATLTMFGLRWVNFFQFCKTRVLLNS